MRSKIAILAAMLAMAGTTQAEAKRGFSMKGLFGSSKSAPAPAAASAPKPAAPAPAQAAAPKPTPAAAPAPATASKPATPAAPAAATAPAPAAATPSRGTFIFVSTGGTRSGMAAEKKDDNKQRLEQLPASETTATVNDPANALIKPAGYKAPVLGGAQPASASSAPGFKLVN